MWRYRGNLTFHIYINALQQVSPNSLSHQPLHEISDCSLSPKYLLYEYNVMKKTLNTTTTKNIIDPLR